MLLTETESLRVTELELLIKEGEKKLQSLKDEWRTLISKFKNKETFELLKSCSNFLLTKNFYECDPVCFNLKYNNKYTITIYFCEIPNPSNNSTLLDCSIYYMRKTTLLEEDYPSFSNFDDFKNYIESYLAKL